jgi:CheY-like chemotaxis protein
MGLFSGLFDPFLSSRKRAVEPVAVRTVKDFRIVVGRIPAELAELCRKFENGGQGWWGVVGQIPAFKSHPYAYARKRDLTVSLLQMALPEVQCCAVYALPDDRVLAVAKLPPEVSVEAFSEVVCEQLRPAHAMGQAVTRHYDLSQPHGEFWKTCREIKASLVEQENVQAMQQQFNVQAMTEFSLTEAQKAKRRERTDLSMLIVEDDPSTAALLVHLIGRNAQAVSAADAVSAVRKYRQVVPDLVFLDIGLPDMNGLELLKKLVGGDNGACVVMLTAQAYRQNLDKAARWGAQGFIAKPFRRERLAYYLKLAERLKAERRAMEGVRHA